jgi:hypothetical protein
MADREQTTAAPEKLNPASAAYAAELKAKHERARQRRAAVQQHRRAARALQR